MSKLVYQPNTVSRVIKRGIYLRNHSKAWSHMGNWATSPIIWLEAPRKICQVDWTYFPKHQSCLLCGVDWQVGTPASRMATRPSSVTANMIAKEREYIEMLEATRSMVSFLEVTTWESKTTIAWRHRSFPWPKLVSRHPCCSSDNYVAGGVLAAQTLVKTGAQSIITLQGMTTESPYWLRHAGFCTITGSPILSVLSNFLPSEKKNKNILIHQKPQMYDFCFGWRDSYPGYQNTKSWEFLFWRAWSSAMMGPTLSRTTILIWQLLSNLWDCPTHCRSFLQKIEGKEVGDNWLLYPSPYYQEKAFRQNSDWFVWAFYNLKFSR